VIRVGGADRDRTDDLFNAIPCSTLPTSVGPGKLEQRELSPVALPLSPLAEAPWYLAPKLGAVPASLMGVSPALLTHQTVRLRHYALAKGFAADRQQLDKARAILAEFAVDARDTRYRAS
jgi:hypothetical protein